MKFKHRYVDYQALTTAGGLSNYQFSVNGLYDPNITGVGSQPMYFDQMAAIYNHYTVIGSKCTIKIVPQGTAVQEPYQCTLWINDDTTTTPNDIGIAEGRGAYTSLSQGGVNPKTIVLKKNWSLKKAFAGNVSSSQFQGTNTANPSEQEYFQLSFRPLSGANTVSIYAWVSIEYIAVWKELKDIATS